MTAIHVTTGARLHFGLLCGKPDSGWHYGGIGMMIAGPTWQICLKQIPTATADHITASEPARIRIQNLLQQFRDQQFDPGPVSCTVSSEVSFHAGLGSGTQLTLAMGNALLLLAGRPRLTTSASVAAELGRSRRSAIGTFGFDYGGFITDRGRHHTAHDSTIQHQSFPESWRMVLITPKDTKGLYGQQEESFFGSEKYLDDAALARITEVIELNILPALQMQNFPQFAGSLGSYGQLIGQYYATQQGGVYSSPLIRSLVPGLTGEGISLPVQSSWGPTVCIPAESENEARRIGDLVMQLAGSHQADILITAGLNVGATIRSPAPEDQRSLG